MKERYIEYILQFCKYLREEEKSRSTIEKYQRDVRKLLSYLEQYTKDLTKVNVLAYKEYLMEHYETSSVNSMLAAANQFLGFIGKEECRVKQIKIQRQTFVKEERYLTKQEFKGMMQAAKALGKYRLGMIMEVMFKTGIRVGELRYITVERLRSGKLQIHNKGKTRSIIMVKELQQKLLCYAKKQGIKSGALFVTKGGNAVDRSNLWREIQAICRKAGVEVKKGFPHNLRHLFARCFYEAGKNLVDLADMLGHSSIETTRIYTMTTYETHIDRLEKMRHIFELGTT